MTDITHAPAVARAGIVRRVSATILDLFTVFMAAGYAIAALTGNLTPDGFHLKGAPAAMLFAIIVVYFYVGRRHLGGTLWDRILFIGRPQPYY